MHFSFKRDTRDLIISDDVISKIAANAASDVEGFGSFYTRTPDVLSELLPEKLAPSRKPVKIESKDSELKISLYINVTPAANVQKTTADIQQAVKNAVQSMTGNVVLKVNVYIHGIDFCEPD
ncbi:MAG: Asp23/Gls24 family envelope stress response protein [Clostridia bacterium]|nr:Asp23/Gls24 family envelope stress response protein [Clostridia bacterium]